MMIFASLNLYSQVTFNYTIKGGRNVDLIFNSLKKLNDGITYSNFTKFTVNYDLASGTGYWKLYCKANTANIEGEDGNSLSLATIEIKPSCALCSGATLYNEKLSSSDVLLIENGPEGSNIDISITYEVGVDDTYKLFLKNPDNYFVDIIFWFEYNN
jgi:hypothetical protein